MILIVSSTSAITLKIDPSVVLATRQYVDDKVIEVKAYADDLLAAHLAAADPHTQYLKTADIDKYIPVGFRCRGHRQLRRRAGLNATARFLTK
jgi:hypothetical protein